MGQVIAAVAYFLVVNVGIPLAVVDAALVIAWSALLSAASSALFGPKVPKPGVNAGVQVMARSALEYRKIIYGQAAVSGPVYYNNISGDGKYLWHGIALTHGESEDFVGVYFDKEYIQKADIAWAAGSGASDGTGTGNVSTARWIGKNSTFAAQIFYYLGDDAQPVPGSLSSTFSDYTSSHRLRGITHIVTKFLYNEDTEDVWKGGPPNNIRVVLKGRKIYDPRLDATQIIDSGTSPITYGVGSHRTATASTWVWSDNPALCVADYLMNIMGVAATSIDWESVAAAADDCEVQVVIPPAASPENIEDRFTCNGALSLGSRHKDNLDAILSSMDGRLSYSGGMWKVRASVWESPSVTITADDLVGDIEVRGSAPKSERFNAIRGFFVDPNRDYESVEFPHISDSTYLTRDNGKVIEYDLQLPMTNNETTAQRIAMRMLEHGNDQTICNLKMNARGAKATVGDVVSVTVDSLSWSAKTFRVIEWSRGDSGTYDVTLKEDNSGTYTDPVVGDYGTGNTGGVTLPTDVVPAPTNLSVSSRPYGILVSWTNPAVNEFDFIDVYVSSTSAWSAAAKVASVRSNTYTHSVGAGEVRYFWVRARRQNDGLESDRLPNSDTSSVVGTAGSGTDSVQIVGAALSDKLTPVSPATDAEVSYRLASTGEEQSYTGDGGTHADIADWLLAGSAGGYDCRLTKNSGTDPTGSTMATWHDMGTTRTWTLTDATAGGGVISNNCTIEIRDGTTFDVLASGTVTMEVENQLPPLALTGGSVSATNAGANAVADLKIDDDGNVYKRENSGSWVQLAAGSNWIRPTSSSPDDYEVRYTNASGDTGSLTVTASTAVDTWYALSGGDFILTVTASTIPGNESVTLDVEIRKGSSGVADVSATYTITADKELGS